MKKVLLFVLVAILLCSCADTAVKNSGDNNESMEVNNYVISENTDPADTEPARTESADSSEEKTEQTTKKPFFQFYEEDVWSLEREYLKDELEFNQNYWRSLYDDLRARPESTKEVTIFADNTTIYYKTGFRKVSCDFGPLTYSVSAPDDWSRGLRYYRDYYLLENTATGMAIYDGEIPVIGKKAAEYTEMIYREAAGPMTKSIFFLGEMQPHGGLPFSIPDYITKFDHETYVDRKGRTLQVYFLDGLPKCAYYEDFYNLFIWFNLKSEEQIPIAVYMVDSIEISLSWEAKWALEVAEDFGYTIIPPEY